MYLKNFDRYFSPLQWQIILKTAQIAQDLNLRAFGVGGIVRDAIVLENHPSPPLHKDLDLVFDGAEKAGIKVAIALHELFPASKLQVHEKFQTASLSWQDADHNFEMDMATARREIYEYAGANPQVMATTLKDDLWRRDFTVNALAIELDPQLGIKGQVIDRFNGLTDLANKQVRAICKGSFEEDPRRLFRAVRFAVRLDFAIAPETYAEITATTSSGIHDAIGGARLKAELLYTLAEPKAGDMFALLQKLGALRCIHPELTLPTDMANSFKHQWRRSQYWLKLLNQLEIKTYAPLQIGLELLLSYLPDQISTQLDLGLTPEQKIRQQKLADLIVNLSNSTNLGLKKSDITQSLQKFDIPTLILAGIKWEPAERRIVWQYLSQWQLVKSPLTGADLTQLGYTKGKQMGDVLQSLRFAAIDREIQTKEDAIAYLQAQN
jgi:tRNA nucleotidyltransferase (CCA-adding enzyme)